MIYCCEKYGFLFQRMGEIWECPFCEDGRFRPATAEETERLNLMLTEEKQKVQEGRET